MSNLRVLYAIEFLIALIATFTVWSQVGGQGHLDLMPWYWKLVLSVGVSCGAVKATAAATADRTWNPRTLKWVGIMLAFAMACAAVTYYYHLYEPEEEQEEEPGVTLLIPSGVWQCKVCRHK